jgi:hypothetical protein
MEGKLLADNNLSANQNDKNTIYKQNNVGLASHSYK